MRILFVFLVLIAACTGGPTKKVRQPDMQVPIDGDFMAGCGGAITYIILLQELVPNHANIDATCMDLYLKWLEHKSKL